MEFLDQENHEICEEVTTLSDRYERLTAMMEALVAAQNPPLPPPPTPLQRTDSVAPIKAPQHHMPYGFP